ncbi:MAG: hypothetical protein JST21_18005 [Bacteroidetes bacterium]|nr:hypothetical protein [Bacteroidota bacterium]
MKSALLIFLLFTYFILPAQTNHTIQVNDALTAHQYEFSALANWKNKIVLIPQNHNHVIDSVFLIKSSAIQHSIKKNRLAQHTSFAIKNIRHEGVKKDSLYIGDVLLTHYEGIEACVIKNNTIYFSLETDTSFCYIIKGNINKKDKTIFLLSDTIHIPNTYNINNAGYESLAYLPGKDSLIAFFECNKDTATARAFIVGVDLKGKPSPIQWERPLYFRLTDVFAINNSELIGINRLFTMSSNTRERDDYLKGTNMELVNKQFSNGGNIDTCFNQIIKISIRQNKLNWQPLAFVSLGRQDNYEGIVPFRKGVLLVVDGEPGNNPCKLVYISAKY